MTIPVEQLQKLDNITIIELFELQLFDPIHYATGDTSVTTLYRFHNGTSEINANIVWDGNSYTAIACQAEGFESGDNTTMARPTITFANTVGNFSAILEIVNAQTPFNDLQKGQIRRIRTLAQFLDKENFANQINPYGNPDPTKKFSDDTFEINKKIVENNQICSFELVNTIDSEDLTLPRNQITKDRFPAAGSFVFV
tara:strand:- start:1271 stop:1864 length:594 start_codon:yes stop_codon:yes gene_type:complete